MVSHDKEEPTFTYTLETERQALLATKALRGIPQKAAGKLLAATWNLTNFGLQKRTNDDLALMAEIINWFDLVAIQEVADDLTHLRTLMSYLPSDYHVIISDLGGNDERAGFLYDSAKLARLELAAEVAIPPSDQRNIRMKGVSGAFTGFDRNPYVVAFQAGNLEFMAVSVHLYYGSKAYYDKDRRALEAYALARWAENRKEAAGAYSQKILIMGDFNLTVRNMSSNVFRALKDKGLSLPEYDTAMGSNLEGDKDYDQLAFHSGGMKNAFSGRAGVFDFDHTPFFNQAWNKSKEYFDTTVRYHIADHRPLWGEFNT